MTMQPLDLYESVPRRTAELSIHLIDDDALARLPGAQRVVCLNRSARAVLEQIDGRRTIREIAGRLAAPLGLSAEHLLEDVADAVLSFVSSSLVAVAAPAAGDHRPRTRDTDGLAIRFADQTVHLSSPSSAVHNEVHSRFTLMLSAPAASPDGTLRVETHRDAWVYFGIGTAGAGDVVVTRSSDGMHARDYLKAQVVQCCMRLRPDLLWLHAGAADVDGRCVLVAGTNGRGKSALIAELCRAGARYLSDEIVPVDSASRRAIPFPLTPIQRESRPAPLPRHRLRELKRYYVPMTAAQVCPATPRIAAVVFPEFVAAGRPQLEPCRGAESAVALIESSLDATIPGADAVERVLALCGAVPAARLTFRDARDGAARIKAWLGRRSADAGSHAADGAREERDPTSALIAS